MHKKNARISKKKRTRPAKVRSFAQRVGTAGENAFRNFALRVGLTANKVEDDFGVDFFCEVEGQSLPTRSVEISGRVTTACVRATSQKQPRIRLDKSDAGNLLRLDTCAALYLVALHAEKLDQAEVYFSFVDVSFSAKLQKFIGSDKDSLTLTPADLKPESEFQAELMRCTSPGFRESVQLTLAENAMRRYIPGVRIQIHREKLGVMTAVTAVDFLDYFDHLSDEGHELVYRAVFGNSVLRDFRIGEILASSSIVNDMRRLPHPFVVAGNVYEEEQVLKIVAGRQSTSCPFAKARTKRYVGWAHEAGVSITMTLATELDEDGRHVHVYRTFMDPDVKMDPFDYPALTDFFSLAWLADAAIHIDKFSMEAVDVPGLRDIGHLAAAWKEASQFPGWQNGLVTFQDAGNDEVHHTMAFLMAICQEPQALNSVNFFISETEDDQIPSRYEFAAAHGRPAELYVPVIANTSDATLVARCKCISLAYVDDKEALIGINVESTHSFKIEVHPRLSDKNTIYPEVVVGGNLPTLPMNGEKWAPKTRVPGALRDLYTEVHMLTGEDID